MHRICFLKLGRKEELSQEDDERLRENVDQNMAQRSLAAPYFVHSTPLIRDNQNIRTFCIFRIIRDITDTGTSVSSGASGDQLPLGLLSVSAGDSARSVVDNGYDWTKLIM